MIGSQYVVLKYGNMITGEFLNIGVYTYEMAEDKPEVYCQFLQDWSRVNAAFGLAGSGSKDPILESLLANYFAKLDTKEALHQATQYTNSPYSSVYFTEPRGSILPAKALLADTAATMLVE